MLNQDNSLLLMIDVQEKLVGMLQERAQIIKNKAQKLIQAAQILKIKTIITEQYPKGLGSTISEVQNVLSENFCVFEKTNFSALKEKDVLEQLESEGKKQVVLFGIEAHICVMQTAIELKEKGFEVFVVYDASSSRDEKEKELAMKNLRHLGILTLSVESVLFMWLGASSNEHFKEVQALIK